MNKAVYILNSLPWPIIGVIILWFVFFLIRLMDTMSLKKMIANSISQNFTDVQLIFAFSSYIKHHPFSFESTDLIIKMISSLVSEKENVMKWVKKINGKDIHPQLMDSLLYDYFILMENGYKEELDILRKKTKYCFKNDTQFNSICQMIFNKSTTSYDKAVQINGKYSKAIALFYIFSKELNEGHKEQAYGLAEQIIDLVHEKSMVYLIERKKNEYEKEN